MTVLEILAKTLHIHRDDAAGMAIDHGLEPDAEPDALPEPEKRILEALLLRADPTTVVEELDPVFERVRILFRRYVLALRPHAFKGSDPQEVERKIMSFLNQAGETRERRELIRQLDAVLDDEDRWSLAQPDQGRGARMSLADIEARLELDHVTRDILWLLLTPEILPRHLSMYRAVTGRHDQLAWTDGFLSTLVDPYGRYQDKVRQALSPGGSLVRFGLVRELSDASEGPHARRRFRAESRLISHLFGAFDTSTLPEKIQAVRSEKGRYGLADYPKAVRKAVTRAFRGSKRFLLTGVATAGAGSVARKLQADLDAVMLIVKATDLIDDPWNMRVVLRESLLQGAAIYIDEAEALDQERFAPWQTRRLCDDLDQVRSIMYLATMPILKLRTRLRFIEELRFHEINLPAPTADAREARWRDALAEYPAAVPMEQLVAQARIYPLALDDIERTAMLAHTDAVKRNLHLKNAAIDLKDIDRACAAMSSPKLREFASVVRTVATWDDLVLTEGTREAVEDLLNYAKHSDRVLNTWGFGKRMSTGLGLSAMLSGPSGTGKTMISGLIARELGMELYQIDLSRIVSKYIGETEQHLSILFEEAKAGKVALLFDEADSLFAKRTEVKSSVDRYANLETNFLLQKIEEFSGFVLLTTNFPESIDSAFMRRLKFKIHFPQPGVDHRAKLWQVMIPSDTPRDEVIDFAKLARLYELTGGQIRNAVFRAALYAVGDDVPLNYTHLNRAAQSVYREEGRLVRT